MKGKNQHAYLSGSLAVEFRLFVGESVRIMEKFRRSTTNGLYLTNGFFRFALNIRVCLDITRKDIFKSKEL